MLKHVTLLQYLFVVLLVDMASHAFAQSNYILQDEQKLTNAKKQYQAGDADAVKAVATLLTAADKALKAEPYSVTLRKTRMAPSGNPHDYMSQAPYWWADPSKPDGKPYIRKDGERNPEIYQLHDDTQLNDLCTDVKKLGLAYYFTGKEEYAQKANYQLKIFFIDEATRMNPNLNYAQYVPGVNDGRGTGIIESRALTNIPDAFAMMAGSKALTDDVKAGVKTWFAEYLKWLITSKGGKDEHDAQNNHGTIYDMQVIDFAIFTGDTKFAHDMLKKQTVLRMDTQFTLEGKQPLELARTKSWGYSCMNLDGWCKLAILGDRLGIDLWHTTTKDGRGIEKCITYLLPYLLKQKQWEYKQIEPIGYSEMLGICTAANGKYPAIDFKTAFAMYPKTQPWQ
ncbi:alginate lyase family protein [Mucilaginibacter sp. HMF5004]|uniref:alginate lyase family protein n=1 Tax=Mucilaginibacter rivuli TaxID=2857527 RepID=UPI001C5DAC4E|nr:alginate lyase family protein [Mucilaginibacter rivuli]MBW4888574.1 alginate lyase family protein [Mucilaginibacter rivuli]